MHRPATPSDGIDHGLHNLTRDPDTGEFTGIFDWEFTLATPPEYDVACVLANLTLDPWAVNPETPDRDDLVRRSFLDGYAATGDPEGSRSTTRTPTVTNSSR